MRVETIPATRSMAQARSELGDRLRARQGEIEAIIRARVYSVADPGDTGDYVIGIRAAVSAALSYGIEAIAGCGSGRPAPPPAEAIAQARRAARRGVPLDTVLRRYMAGRRVLTEFLILELDEGGYGSSCLKAVLRDEGTAADHLVEAVAAEYRLEVEAGLQAPRSRRSEQVRKLLEGEVVDSGDLGYELDEWHLGAVGDGERAEEALRAIASKGGHRLLLVHQEQYVWGWLGGRLRSDSARVEGLLCPLLAGKGCLALGEPAHGIAGWRLTHAQAAAAMAVARRRPGAAVRYADVILIAAALHDELLATSLHQIYLDPLEQERDGGAVLSETLRAYFGTDRNISSAAAALGVTRRTVANRLRAAEERLGCDLSSAARGLEVALQLAAYDQQSPVSAI